MPINRLLVPSVRPCLVAVIQTNSKTPSGNTPRQNRADRRLRVFFAARITENGGFLSLSITT